MAEKPILFSAPMVRAILDGRKTQTRRVLKPQPIQNGDRLSVKYAGIFHGGPVDFMAGIMAKYGTRIRVGDELWVREAHAMLPKNAYALPKAMNPDDADMAAYYREGFDRSGKIVWRPSIHMPRWASRITLKVTAVKVERLQDISQQDAKAEGCFFTDYGRKCAHSGKGWQDVGNCPAPPEHHPQRPGWMWDRTTSPDQCLHTAKDAFANLWISINGEESWAANPWVAAYSFERVK